MNIRLVLKTLGNLILLIGGCMLIPLIISWVNEEDDFKPFLISFCITISAGLFFKFILKPKNTRFSYREAFSISVLAWLFIALFSALPMWITDHYEYHPIFSEAGGSRNGFSSFINSFFESMSGYTATAATILENVEGIPRALLFWRCFHNWMGGMGIIVLFVAILPSLGAGGMKLFKSEASFSVSDTASIYPKIRDMAKTLWLMYLGLSCVLFILLSICGMNAFDAICHTFSTMSTGGFSTKNASIGHYNSVPIEIIIIIFMFICAINFMLIRFLFFGKWKPLIKNTEFKTFTAIIFLSIILVSIVNYSFRKEFGFLHELREASFNIVSLGTSTGLGTGDFDLWPAFSKIILLFLMVVGGCGGSTAGGLKVVRFVLIFKWIRREFKRQLNPHGVFPILVGDEAVDPKMADAAMGFSVLYILSIFAFAAVISLFENDIVTGFTGVIACISNMGPGFGAIGPTDNFFLLSLPTKFLLTICMLIGRLELFAFFILFMPKVWKK